MTCAAAKKTRKILPRRVLEILPKVAITPDEFETLAYAQSPTKVPGFFSPARKRTTEKCAARLVTEFAISVGHDFFAHYGEDSEFDRFSDLASMFKLAGMVESVGFSVDKINPVYLLALLAANPGFYVH